MAWASRVASRSRSGATTSWPALSWRFETTVRMSALPVRSPYPFTVPCTWLAGLDGGERVGTAQPVSLWQWMPSQAFVDPSTSATTSWHLRRQHPAVGVAEGGHLGAGLGRRADRLERVAAVGGVPVEEVLRVEARCPRRAGSSRCRGSSRGSPRGWCEGLLDVPHVRLADQRGTGAPEASRARTSGSSAALVPARRVAPKAASVAFRRSTRAAARWRTPCPWGSPGPASLDEAHAELVEVARDASLSVTERLSPSSARRRAASCRRRAGRSPL